MEWGARQPWRMYVVVVAIMVGLLGRVGQSSHVISSQQEPTISAATLLLPASSTKIRATITTTLGCFHWCVKDSLVFFLFLFTLAGASLTLLQECDV